MSLAERVFAEIAAVAMTQHGFTHIETRHGDSVVVLHFTKNDAPAFVTASSREIQMNNREDLMVQLVKARVSNGIRIWENERSETH